MYHFAENRSTKRRRINQNHFVLGDYLMSSTPSMYDTHGAIAKAVLVKKIAAGTLTDLIY